MSGLLDDIPADLQIGGVVRTGVLLRHGFSQVDIARAVRRGELSRPRRGWLALPGAHPKVVRAVSAGAVVGCASALAFHGAWDLGDGRPHTYRSEYRRSPKGTRREKNPVWCPQPRVGLSARAAVLDVEDALVQAAYCLHPHDFLAVVESAIHRRLLSLEQVQHLAGGRSNRIDLILDRITVAESGTETLARVRLQDKGIQVRSQQQIGAVGRVDLLVGRRLVIEVDSVQHHTSLDAYRGDRRRDQQLIALGYIVMRVTWEQVMRQWEAVEQDVLAFVSQGLHLGAPLVDSTS